MVCRAVCMWSLGGLIDGFVDLAIAYFLLCASMVAYIASKFLGFFWVCLPCPCTVLGTFSNINYCVRRLLIDCPTEKISNVQLYVRNYFPCNEFRIEKGSNFGGLVIEGGNKNNGFGYVEMIDCKGSCSSVSDARKGLNVARRLDGGIVREEGFDVKGKGVMNERPPGWLRCQIGGAHSLSGLIGSFIDLAIAYFLLCASAVAYIASKVLGFFGLCLPCPCTVLSTFSNSNYVSDARKGLNVARRGDGGVVREEGFDVKGKGVMNERPPGWLRCRRGGSSVASCDPQSGDVCCGYLSLSDKISKGKMEIAGDIIGHLDNAIDSNDSNWQTDVVMTDEFPEENDEEEKLSTSIVEMAEPPQNFSSSFGDKNAVSLLKQALKEEQAAHIDLYIELEKERSASASAADEAMAMIIRLQEEKAMVEMEARQYQRIIEEKFAYDAEEMNILKDILLIREMEKYSLEKEVEEYRQMINLCNEQIQDDAGNFEKKHLDFFFDPSEHPVFLIDKTTVSIDEKASLKDMQALPCNNDVEQNVQDKEMIPICLDLCVPPQNEKRQEEAATSTSRETSSSQEHNFSDKPIQVVGEDGIQERRG